MLAVTLLAALTTSSATPAQGVLTRGLDASVWWYGQSGWQSIGGQVAADPIACALSDTRLAVVVRGLDQALWVRLRSEETWDAWRSLGGVLAGDPACIARDGTLHVLAVHADRQMWHLATSGRDGTWMAAGGEFEASVRPSLALSAGGFTAVARGLDRAVWAAEWDGSWTPWRSLGGEMPGDAAPSFIGPPSSGGASPAAELQGKDVNPASNQEGQGLVRLSADGELRAFGSPQRLELSAIREHDDAKTLWLWIDAHGLSVDKIDDAIAQADGSFMVAMDGWPVGAPTAMAIDVTFLPVEGAALRIIAADNRGGHGRSELFWRPLSLDVPVEQTYALPVADALGVVAPQAEAFARSAPWARRLVTTAAEIGAGQPVESPPWSVAWDLFDLVVNRGARSVSRQLLDDIEQFHGRRRGRAAAPANEPIPVTGRVLFPDDDRCTAAATSRVVSAEECRRFKRLVNALGYEATAADRQLYRALEGTALLQWERWFGGSPVELCDVVAVPLDPNGAFSGHLRPCATGLADGAYRLTVTVFLVKQLAGVPGSLGADAGYLRAYWRNVDADRLYGLTDFDVVRYAPFEWREAPPGFEGTYSIPAVRFVHHIDRDTAPPAVHLGGRILAADSRGAYNYLRALLSAYSTFVELHRRTRAALDPTEYLRMFPEQNDVGHRRTYALYFNDTWATATGGRASLHRPAPVFQPFLVSSVGTLAHEFGHSIHASLAGSSVNADYSYANAYQTPDGTLGGGSGHSGGEYQEMGTAFTEGLASGLGQFLLNGCSGADGRLRAPGGVSNFAQNQWGGEDVARGGVRNVDYFRRHVRQRQGIAESSDTFLERLRRVRALTAEAVAEGHRHVLSNNELRIAEFTCDLLDDDTDTSYLRALAPLRYVRNYTYQTWQLMYGRATDSHARALPFPSDVGPETIRLSLPQLLAAAGAFCPGCRSLPTSHSDDAYARERLSIDSAAQSPQTLGRYMVSRGLITGEQLQTLLAANLMDEP